MKSLVNESRLFIDQKRYDDAIDRLTRASMIDTESSEVFRLLGRTYTAKGDTEHAIAAYRAALQLNEEDAWSMNNLGLLLVQAKRADEALPLLAKATELQKDVAEFHNNLGMPGLGLYHDQENRPRSAIFLTMAKVGSTISGCLCGECEREGT